MSVKGKASVAELSKLIDANLLAAWLKELKASGVQRDDLMKESELQQQCSEFVDLLRTAAQSGNPEVRSPAWAPVREFLEQISRSRAIQGATPTQIATFVFSLKRPLFDRVRSEAGKDVDLQADQVWVITQLVDELGLLTLEAFQKTREDVIGRQQQEMLELSTPVVKLWDGVLALPMIGTLDSARTQVVMETLLQRIVETGAEIAIIDITGVPTVDTLVAQHLLKTITAARLMGADCIISGIRPQIAQTIVHLGVDLADVITKASLADAFALALKRTGVSFVKSAGVPSRRERMDRIPILRMGKLLLVTIQVDMHDRLAMTLQDDLTAKITQTQARGVLIDISSLEMVDSFIGRMLANIAAMSRVLDAQTVVVGMQPAVAITLVELGMSLPGVRMALNVERGMDLLQASLKEDLAVEGDDASRQE